VIRPLSLWLFRLVLLAPAALLLFAAVPRFQAGLAVDAAFPVPAYLVMNAELPVDSYRAAAVVLAKANPQDGRSLIERAEAAARAGTAPQTVEDLLSAGLARSPASVRGWSLLAEQVASQEPARGVAYLSQSYLLGPYEYFVAGKRSRTAAILWNDLPAKPREIALRQTKLLWSETLLHSEIGPLLSVQGGSALMTLAFKDDPEEMRALNRWLATERRRAAARN
jgi:hypothetical protein